MGILRYTPGVNIMHTQAVCMQRSICVTIITIFISIVCIYSNIRLW